MAYCSASDKQVTVNYGFGFKDKQAIFTVAPIEVTTEYVPAAPKRYKYFDPNLPGERIWTVGNRYEISNDPICRQGNLRFSLYQDNTLIDYSCYLPGSLEILPATNEYCKIEVKTVSGILLFSDRGDCPVLFDVKCGEGCPDGYLKLDSPNYPGYCCIPCSEVIGGIKSITAAVRGINRG